MSQLKSRIDAITPEKATGEASELFQKSEEVFGMIPNLFHHLALSPKVLHGFLELQLALEQGVLSEEERESIALRVGESNKAGYCVAMHNYVGEEIAGLTQEQISNARRGKSSNEKTQAILSLTDKVMDNRGLLSDTDVESVRFAGVSDAEIVETVANIAWNILANYIDGIAVPASDTPPVELFD